MDATKKITPAKNTEEFIAKYGKKRFSPSTAGKAYLLNLLCDAYSMSETGIQTTLWNIDSIRSKVQSEEDIQSFDAYYFLTEWLRILYEESRTMRNALQSQISNFSRITTSVLVAEQIRRRLIETKQQDKLIMQWLSTQTIDAYTPQTDGSTILQKLRENIGEGLRYMRAYYTFLSLISDFTGIPECMRLSISMTPIKDALENLNEALELLRDDVAANRGILELDVFQPIDEPPPVPDQKLQLLRDTLRRDFKKQYINWYVLYARYSVSYRIPAMRTGEGD